MVDHHQQVRVSASQSSLFYENTLEKVQNNTKNSFMSGRREGKKEAEKENKTHGKDRERREVGKEKLRTSNPPRAVEKAPNINTKWKNYLDLSFMIQRFGRASNTLSRSWRKD